MITALIIVLVAIGSVVFHLMSPWWWTEIASNWGFIDTTIIITFWVTGIVYTAILLFVGYCIWKFRFQEGRKVEYEPENPKLEWWLTALTSIGVVIMLAPGLIAWKQRSVDVLHDFYVPQFRGKMDIIPGMVTYFWFTPIRTGNFEILCAELCGVGHHAMRGNVIVDNQSSYDTWLNEQQTFEQSMAQFETGNSIGKTAGLASKQVPDVTPQKVSAQ
jgi:heme/copper-type cytochrome/quinol oxidase subunit 2